VKILITGASGLLGNNLAAYFCRDHDVIGLYNQHPVAIRGVKSLGADLRDYESIRFIVSDFQPQVIIHCASRTDVDGIEKDKEGGWQANVLTTRALLDATRDVNTKFVHISTDAVYQGESGPNNEEMTARPQNWYGETKLEAEHLVRARKDALVLRTNIYGWNIQDKKSLAEWFIYCLENKEPVTGFSDALFSSIYSFSLARLIEECLGKKLSGVFNCACSDACSKYDFGRRIAAAFGYDQNLITPGLIEDHGFEAHRGNDLSLDVAKLTAALGHRLPTMAQCLADFHRDSLASLPQSIRNNRDVHPYRGEGVWPIRQAITYGGQVIDKADIDAVVRTMKSSNLTQGPMVDAFEKNLGKMVGSSHVVAVNSGTSALHIACLACGVGPGDEVITSPNTFVASANCAVYCGATPVFGDIDPLTYNIRPSEIEKKINARTKAVVPVHFAGQSCDMATIEGIVRKAEKKYGHRIFIIEDGCHAFGSKYRGNPFGACTHSDMAATSFHPVKHITTGEGGAIFTNDNRLEGLLRRFRSHGITSKPGDFVYPGRAFDGRGRGEKPVLNPWYYEQHALGFNYRIADIQCALGNSQLCKLEGFRKARRFIVEQYNTAFKDIKNIRTPFEQTGYQSNFHLYVLCIDFERLKTDRGTFMNTLRERGVQTQVHYIPVHTQPFYQKNFDTRWGDCPEAERYYNCCLSIPLFPGMGDEQVQKVIDEILFLCRG
jgi:perosamine synthetase